jgi:hypothetical protein
MSEFLTGRVEDGDGNPVVGAVVEVSRHINGNDDRGEVILRETDANGEFDIELHPEGDGTAKDWHVMARDEDGTTQFNTVSEPRRDVALKDGLTFFVRSVQDETVTSGNTLDGHTKVRNQPNSRLVTEPNARVETQPEIEIW